VLLSLFLEVLRFYLHQYKHTFWFVERPTLVVRNGTVLLKHLYKICTLIYILITCE